MLSLVCLSSAIDVFQPDDDLDSASVHSAVYTNTPSVCSVNEFTCGDGACVTRESRCDGIQHCADNSDEQDCWNDSKGDFHCRDGTCVTFDKKCDGLVDCPDGSDETHALCRNIRCPSNLFRCTYGACADGTAACNGIKECADNSDELLPKCRNEVEEVRGRFTCKNGETIDSTDHCDGVANCSDGSDETIESCAGKRCPSYLFQCAYGACVDNGANCNGKTDCIDGSDEADDLCNRTTIATTYRPAGACVLPEYPKHGKYIVKGIPNAKPHQSYQSAILTVTCDPGYGVVGINTTYCFSGNDWLGSVPTCSRFCKVTPHPSVNYKCKVTGEYGLHGTRLCHEYEPSGTEVIPECNRPNYHHSGFLAHMHCIDGNWDSTAICQPGTTSVGSNITIIVNDKIYVYVSGTDYSISIGNAVEVHTHQNVTQLFPVFQPSPVTSIPSEKPISAPTVSPKPSTEAPVASTPSPIIAKPSTPVLPTRVPTTNYDTIWFPNEEASISHVVNAPVAAVTPVDTGDYYFDQLDESWWRIGS
ncbi:hypothetical protein MSG28_014602 [Choristoneura fumiferana]|uniref:Uncharacterized protein n=1 Tax=Choristoneura fumiferana TaxID=7141 RepID=A0ACC0JSI1_CHOFU|nr:hypothetical protein MSG28_014602 [Choristoneura fumiferana]